MIEKILSAPERYGRFVVKYRFLVLLGALAVGMGAMYGAQFIGFDNSYRVFFGEENPQLLAFDALEQIYDKNDNAIGQIEIPGSDLNEKVFLGLITKDPAVTIGRIDIWDKNGGQEGISLIAAYWQGPGDQVNFYTDAGAFFDDAALALACDMPFIEPNDLRALIAARGDALAVAPWRDGRFEPLCALYDVRARSVVDARVASGDRTLQGLLHALGARRITLPRAHLDDWDSPEDLSPEGSAPEESA